MNNITVEENANTDTSRQFTVRVDDGVSQSEHLVTIPEDMYQQLTQGKITHEELLEKTFEFLLERESKESILFTFNLNVITSYFPEYEDEIKKIITAS